jgi:hypothetical protein
MFQLIQYLKLYALSTSEQFSKGMKERTFFEGPSAHLPAAFEELDLCWQRLIYIKLAPDICTIWSQVTTEGA